MPLSSVSLCLKKDRAWGLGFFIPLCLFSSQRVIWSTKGTVGLFNLGGRGLHGQPQH